MTETALLEREAEVSAIAAAIASAREGRGNVLFIEGPAGIGKTRLLSLACRQARQDGVAVLAASADELEAEYAYGVVRSLFEPTLVAAGPDGRALLLSGAARLVAPVLMLDEVDPRSGAAAPLDVLHSVYWLTVNLSESGPLLLAVDDLHWADASSIRALAYVTRRLADLPVVLVVSVRSSEPEAPGSPIEMMRHASVTTAIHPNPLTPEATIGLVHAVFGRSADPAFCAACQESTGGNPLLVRALLEALREAAIEPDAGGIEAVRERAPAIVATFVMPRLRHVSSSAAAVAHALAVLGPGAELRHVAAMTELDARETADAVDELVTAQLLAPGRPLTFSHPLFRQAIAERMSASERHRCHVHASRLLAADGADPEQIAAHLLPAERLGEVWVVDQLRAAARRAAAKGEPQVAVAYLRRALEEPPDAQTRPEVLFEYGTAQARVSVPDGLAALQEALTLARDPGFHGRVAVEMAKALQVTTNYHRAYEVVRAALDRLGDEHPTVRLELEAEFVGIARREPELRPMVLARARQLHEAAAVGGHAGARVLGDLALDMLQREGSSQEAVTLASQALTVRPTDGAVVVTATMVLRSTDDVDAALAGCDAGVADAQARGALLDLGACAATRALVHHQMGNLVDAEADARLADELAEEIDVGFSRRYTQAALVQVLIDRGDLDGAEESLVASGVGMTLAYLLFARGRLRLAQGRSAEALDDLQVCGDRLVRRGIAHPGLVPWWPDAALAAHQVGEQAAARALVSEAIDRARRFDARRPLGLALRAHGLIEDRRELLQEAVSVLGATPARLEHARALIDLGAALRRANQRGAARQQLKSGLDLAHRCGANALADRAREELACTGARVRRPALVGIEALTPSERRVAQMASQGLSNREVAQALFLNVKTVESHLASAYRKLGITGRQGLASALA